jgi:hypothetical protein
MDDTFTVDTFRILLLALPLSLSFLFIHNDIIAVGEHFTLKVVKTPFANADAMTSFCGKEDEVNFQNCDTTLSRKKNSLPLLFTIYGEGELKWRFIMSILCSVIARAISRCSLRY